MWRITEDKISESCGWASKVGTHSAGTKEPTIKFRLLDDDGKVYFVGMMSAYSFAPLDNFGAGYGCTELQYWEDGHWTTL